MIRMDMEFASSPSILNARPVKHTVLTVLKVSLVGFSTYLMLGSAWQINQPAFLLGADWKNKATPVKVDSNVEKYEHRDQEDPRESWRSPTSVRLMHGVIRGPINPGIWVPPPSNYGPSRLAFSVKIFNEAGAVSFKVYRHRFILMLPVGKNCIEEKKEPLPFLSSFLTSFNCFLCSPLNSVLTIPNATFFNFTRLFFTGHFTSSSCMINK
ncbi:hypothetical protein NC651_025371 [Populus alba x Populus x berolinensis]|nr:hypothetical protein NC651_025371 [Populus alba x Populus x berolinensis]